MISCSSHSLSVWASVNNVGPSNCNSPVGPGTEPNLLLILPNISLAQDRAYLLIQYWLSTSSSVNGLVYFIPICNQPSGFG